MIWGCFMAGAAPDFYFKQLSQRDGLPQNSVRTIILDHKGFLWIGTKSGVSRFDYYEFKNYTAVPDLVQFVAGKSHTFYCRRCAKPHLDFDRPGYVHLSARI